MHGYTGQARKKLAPISESTSRLGHTVTAAIFQVQNEEGAARERSQSEFGQSVTTSETRSHTGTGQGWKTVSRRRGWFRKRWSRGRLHEKLLGFRGSKRRRSHVGGCRCSRRRSSWTPTFFGSFRFYHWASPPASSQSFRDVVLFASPSDGGRRGWASWSSRPTSDSDGFSSSELRDDSLALLCTEYVVVIN